MSLTCVQHYQDGWSRDGPDITYIRVIAEGIGLRVFGVWELGVGSWESWVLECGEAEG